MRTVFKTLALTATIAATGCTLPATQTPTHRWVSEERGSELDYAMDHARCLSQAGYTNGTRTLDTKSRNYGSYSSCMASRGYTLAAYKARLQDR
ncbi:MAG: hypothetical protein AAF648_15925 [Pseudomonadota bacterium]